MKDISLKDLLAAGCHFGHRVERWHPKAASFIYQAREGIHIIDLAQTRDSLRRAAEFVKNLAREGKILLLVATKRQAKGVVSEAAKRTEIPYLTNRWIGGFFTNWDEVKKNIEKLRQYRHDKETGGWQKFPKHEIAKLTKILNKLETVYGGAAQIETLPDALFIVDIKKEQACLREALRKNITVVAIVDTNTDPTSVDYPIPANDDAVGSLEYVTNFLVDAYSEGKKIEEKEGIGKKEKVEEEPKVQRVKEVKKEASGGKSKGKSGRPKKTTE